MRIIGNDPSVPRQTQEVASGTLPNGKPVVVNADGTVSVISGSAAAFGAQQEFEDAAIENLSGTYDTTNDRIVFVYPDAGNSYNGKVVAGQVDNSNNTISFGSPVRVNSAFTGITSISVDFDTSNGKLLIVYVGNSKIYAKVGTVDSSDNSISLGSRVEIDSGSVNMGPGACKYDPDTGKFLLVYNIDGGDSKGVVATVSGTSVSFGTKATWESSANTSSHQMVYDTGSNKFVVAFLYGGASLRCRVATVSGTDVSFSNATFIKNGATSNHFGLAYDSTNNKIVAAYSDPGNSNYGTASIGTVTTTCDFSGATVFESATSQEVDAAFNPTTGAVDIAYKDAGNSQKGTFISATISSGSLTFNTAEAFTTGEANVFHLVYDPDTTKMIIGFRDHTTSQNGVAVIRQPNTLNLTSENYIGMSSGPIDVTSQTESIGSAVVFNSTGNTTKPHLCFDTNSNKTVIGFVDNAVSEKGTAIVGTVSGTSISFGSETVYETSVTDFPAMVFDSSNNKVIVAYQDEGNNDYGTAAVGTVSGTSISFGTPVVFESAAVQHVSLAFDSNSNKVVVSYADNGNSEHGTAIVGTVSGTSISFGSAAVFQSAQSQRINSTFDSSNNKVVIAYRTSTGQAVVGTVSGTSISFGSPVQFKDELTDELDIVFDSNANKVVIAYLNGAGSLGLAKVGTVSGTSISFGAEATFESDTVYSISPVFDSSINKVVIVYQDADNSNYGTSAVGTISGTDITFETPTVFASVNVYSSVGATFDSSNNKVVIAYRDGSNSNYGTSVVMLPGFTDITRGEVADGGHALVDTQGAIADNQTGLTPAQSYFVQNDGTLGTTAADPSVFAGTAVSATKLIVKG